MKCGKFGGYLVPVHLVARNTIAVWMIAETSCIVLNWIRKFTLANLPFAYALDFKYTTLTLHGGERKWNLENAIHTKAIIRVATSLWRERPRFEDHSVHNNGIDRYGKFCFHIFCICFIMTRNHNIRILNYFNVSYM